MSEVSLSVVIPAYNAAGWISQCLQHLFKSIYEAELADVQVIVVDDGSTDTTAEEAENFDNDKVRVIRQVNQGRFLARKHGLEVSSGSHVLFLDTRVFLHPSSLKFVKPFLDNPNTSLWTAHVEANTENNPIARFWRGIETIFWRGYMTNPTTTSYGVDEFDYYPKGTTALIVPVALIKEAIDAFVPTVTDWRKVNDDTALLRYTVAQTNINISPQYSCTYNARTNLRAFVRHANHRGSVLIDGYLRKGTRLNVPIWLTLMLAPFLIAGGLIWWVVGVLGFVFAPIMLLVLSLILGVRTKDSLVLAGLFWPFAVSYLCGMYWGVILKIRGQSPPTKTTDGYF
jgi:glycosyltransferase involved in cell wall biosynthesis